MDVQTLVADVEQLLQKAEENKAKLGAVNWGDLHVVDVEQRQSLLYPNDKPTIYVMIEEASPASNLAWWLHAQLCVRWPNVFVECDW